MELNEILLLIVLIALFSAYIRDRCINDKNDGAL
jgi:hypothetical protein